MRCRHQLQPFPVCAHTVAMLLKLWLNDDRPATPTNGRAIFILTTGRPNPITVSTRAYTPAA